MTTETILTTSRLILRTWQPEDIPRLAAISSDPQVMMHFPQLQGLAVTTELVKRINAHYLAHGFTLYAVALKESQEFIGFVGLMRPEFEAHFTPAVEIGWRLAQKHWGQGYATEAALAVLALAFNQFELPEVVSFTVRANAASRRVMEKIGLHHDARDDFQHPQLPSDHPMSWHVLYRLSREEYLKHT